MLAKLHLLRGEILQATVLLDESLELAEAHGLTSFRPWPESLRAEIDLSQGDVDAADRAFEHALALGCEVGDPCWESIAACGRGLVAVVERGDVDRGLELLWRRRASPAPARHLPLDRGLRPGRSLRCRGRARPRVGRPLDRRARGDRGAPGNARAFARASVHRARLGEPGALEQARALAAQVDNPALDALVESV